MKATLYFNKHKKNADGEFPVWIRLARKNKMKYVATGITLPMKNWNQEKNEFKGNHPHKEQIVSTLNEIITKYTSKIAELSYMGKEVSLDQLVIMVNNPVKDTSVLDYFKVRIAELKEDGRIGNSRAYITSMNALKRYKSGDYFFSDIDFGFLESWARFLKKEGAGNAAINNYMRTLRALFNHAIRKGYCKLEHYPFEDRTGGYSVAHHHPVAKKQKALTTEEIQRLINLEEDNDNHRYLVFMYYTGGMDFIDMAHLTCNNIADGDIKYFRQKLINKQNQMEIHFGLHPKALEIIDFYRNQRKVVSLDKDDYIFPILHKEIHITEQQKHDRINKMRKKYNHSLKDFAKKANIAADLTSKTIRHTALTELARKGSTIDVIQRIGGHKNLQTTRGYMKNADDERTTTALKQL
ncbi:MAG: site-specific integrase [Bacteroidetes bacterium]|nr:site-specific integrase [Bacteroidota bacterium]